MELEKLTKSQIVLLTLLTSFVSSIATGIVTVSLMEQAPPAIAQTVNRVVERTIEKVVPSSQSAAVATMVPEKTVVVRDSNSIASAVETIHPSVVRLFALGKDEAGKEIEVFMGLAVVISDSGILIADSSLSDAGSLVALRSDDSRVPVAILSKDKENGISRLQGATTTGDKKENVVWKAATVAKSGARLGDTIVAISGRTATRISQGIVTAQSDDKSEMKMRLVETSIPEDAYVTGSPLINLQGEVLGLATTQSRNGSLGGFLASSAIILHNTGSDNQVVQKNAASN